MRRRRLGAFLAGVLRASVGVGTATLASAAQAQTADQTRVAHVTIAGGEDDFDVFIEAMREPLETLGLRLRGARADGAAEPGAVAHGSADAAVQTRDVRVWVDLRHQERVDLVVETGAGDGARVVRRTILRDATRSRAVVAEDVAYSVRATLETLLTLESLAAPTPVPEAPPVTAPPRTPEPRFGLDAAALANVRGVAASTAAFGGGVAADLALWGRHRFRPTLWILGAFDAPFATTTPEVSLETTVYSLRAVPGVELLRVGPFRFAAGAGLGVDLFRVNPSEGNVTPIALRAPTTYADPILEGQILARARLWDSVGIILALSLDYDFGSHIYSEADEAGVVGPVLAPWKVRPAAYVGVCFRLTGASGCAGPR